MIIHKISGRYPQKYFVPCGKDPSTMQLYDHHRRTRPNSPQKKYTSKEKIHRMWRMVTCEKCLKGVQ